MSKAPSTIEDILGPKGLLSRSFQGFEFRPAQLKMALRIQEAINEKMPVIVEAGTGTGKTFGYLVPIILSGKKTVISTGTKNLQEQIFFKDLPLLQTASRLQTDAMIMKGRKNYLCLYRYHQFLSQPSLFKTAPALSKKKLDAWINQTEFGDRAEISWLSDGDPFWDALSSTSDQCLGVQCTLFEECFINRLRNRAARARIIIVNHHLFFADLKIKKEGFSEIIPRFQVVLLDEAHHIEEIGTTYFGESVSTNQLAELAGDIEKKTNEYKLSLGSRFKKALMDIKTAAEELINLFENREPKGRLEQDLLAAIIEGPARELHQGLGIIHEESSHEHLNALVARAGELDQLLGLILHKQDTNWLNWYERRKKTLVFHASPLNISEKMDELLYQKVPTTAFTSATLSTNGNFDYIRSRLNLPENALEGIYPSHFDFDTQTLMYIPRDLPFPNDPHFGEQIAKRISDIVDRSQGRSLVLFTSHHNLNLVWNILKDNVPYTVLKQGDAPRSLLLDMFRNDIHSILLGTASFWQGVDVPGEALSCLIVDKLPFESPGEPLVAAKIDAIRERGGNPFMEYQVPSAVIILKQGLGRLIRKNSDRGVLSIMDKRILTSRYGKIFLDSLPKIPISHDLSDISRFFKEERNK